MSQSYATDPYAVLGVAPNATPDELKRAYRTLARNPQLSIPFGAYDWDQLLDRVHEDDEREARWMWTRRAAWACVALLSAFLLWLGASGR